MSRFYLRQSYLFDKGLILLYLAATLTDTAFSAGPESLAVALFREDEIPWDSLAFSVVKRTLKHYCNDKKTGEFIFRTEVIDKHV